MSAVRAIPRVIRVIVPTALIAVAFGFLLGHQSALSQAPSGPSHAPTSVGQAPSDPSNGSTASPSPAGEDWVQTFTCGGRGALCATLPTNAYRLLDAQTDSIIEIGTIEKIARRSVTVRFPSTPSGAWRIEVTPPGYCAGCGGAPSRDWGPYNANRTPRAALVVSAR